MKYVLISLGSIAALGSLGWYLGGASSVVTSVRIGDTTVVVRTAPELKLPAVPGSSVGYDCNNALFWDGGTLFCFTSHEHPFRSTGPDLAGLDPSPRRVSFDNERGWKDGGRWIEAVYKEPGGRLYMWYHNEPKGVIDGRADLTAPRVGQMASDDNGLHWHDQGIVLEADPSTFESQTANRFFGGGYGDFSVIADQSGEFLYFLFSTYPKDDEGQGVAFARIARTDLPNPVGHVTTFHAGRWEELGLGGRATATFRPSKGWHQSDAQVFWGPSIHWNRHLKTYVALLNRSADAGWKQDGIYIAFNPRLDDPSGWSEPVKILDTAEWYPQVIGTSVEDVETDRIAGQRARLFVKGRSAWEIEFR